MLHQILLATRDDDTAELLTDRLERLADTPGDEVLVDRARHLAEVELRLERGKYALVVSEVELARDKGSPPDREDRVGLELLKSLRARGKSLPFALIDSSHDGRVRRAVQAIQWAEYLPREDEDWDEHLVAVCRALIAHPEFREEDLRLHLEVALCPAGDYRYRMRISGRPGHEDSGPLQIDQRTLDDLLDDSNRVLVRSEESAQADQAIWERRLERIGETLADKLFKSNIRFWTKFKDYQRIVGGRSKVSIRFVVERKVHAIVLEALREDEANSFWMLEAPIHRRVNEFTNRHALFEDEATRIGPLNCLIIGANIEKAFVRERNLQLAKLDNVPVEVAWLKDFLESAEIKHRPPIGRVEVLQPAPDGGDFAARVENTLRQDRWDIVHYAGHSHYDPDSKEGYIYLPGERIVEVPAEAFASWLEQANTRLVYLSSCRSSEQDFAFTLANKLVPAVVGFRWEIDDAQASEYAKCFYQQLFETQSLERGFFEARKRMHQWHKKEPIWAAPMLVVQLMQEN